MSRRGNPSGFFTSRVCHVIKWSISSDPNDKLLHITKQDETGQCHTYCGKIIHISWVNDIHDELCPVCVEREGANMKHWQKLPKSPEPYRPVFESVITEEEREKRSFLRKMARCSLRS